MAFSGDSGPFRPPQWTRPSTVMLSTKASLELGGTILLTYIFDAVLGLDHDQRLVKTHHPVQTGADISSHAYLMPAQCTLYVGMSDAMDAYAHGADPSKPPYITPWNGATSRSVSAYKKLIRLQADRQPMQLVTRLRTYDNVVITHISAREDYKTITGLRARVEFEQIFTASTSDLADSTRTNDTQTTGLGIVNTQPPDQTTVNQFGVQLSNGLGGDSIGAGGTPIVITGANSSEVPAVNTPGAGPWSSDPVSGLPNFLAGAP